MHVKKKENSCSINFYICQIYYRKWSQPHINGWEMLVVNNLSLTFSSHNGDATFSPFSANFCFTNHRLPWEGWLGVSRWIITTLLWFRLCRRPNALVYFLQSYISMGTTWFNEGKWICHRRGKFGRSMYKRFPTYTWKRNLN